MADPGLIGQAAESTTVGSASTVPELWSSMLTSFGMLLLVLAILLMVLCLFRRYFLNTGAAGSSDLIKMVASMYVAPKERIAVVDVLGEKLLIGITSQQISFLARIEDKDNVCETRGAETSSGGMFKALLKSKIGELSKASRGKGGIH